MFRTNAKPCVVIKQPDSFRLQGRWGGTEYCYKCKFELVVRNPKMGKAAADFTSTCIKKQQWPKISGPSQTRRPHPTLTFSLVLPLHSSGSWLQQQEEAKGIWPSELRWARGSGRRESERERERERARLGGGWVVNFPSKKQQGKKKKNGNVSTSADWVYQKWSYRRWSRCFHWRYFVAFGAQSSLFQWRIGTVPPPAALDTRLHRFVINTCGWANKLTLTINGSFWKTEAIWSWSQLKWTRD